MTSYSIKQAAQATGVSVASLHYYEREGLIRDVQRLSNGHRRYSEEDLGWIEFLTCMRDSGMPIKRLKRYVDLCYQEGTGHERCHLLEAHREVVKTHIEALELQLERIENKIAWYHKALADQDEEQG